MSAVANPAPVLPGDRGKGWFTIGTWMSIALPLAVAPLWSRIYPLPYFAESALVQAVAGLFASWASGSFHLAIASPVDESEAAGLCLISLLLVTAVAVGFAMMLMLMEAGGQQTGAVGIAQYSGYVPLLILGNGTRLVLDQFMIRLGLFRELGTSLTLTAVLTVFVPAVGLLDVDAGNFLLLGTVVGTLGGALLRLHLSAFARVALSSGHSLESIRNIARRYRNFPRDLVPGSFLTNVGLQLPQLMLAKLADSTVLAHYSRAMTLVALPVSVLGQPLSAMYQRDGALAYRVGGDCRAALSKVTVRLALLLVPVYSVFLVLADWLLPFAFGPAWEGAGTVARPMMVSMLVSTVAAPAGFTLLFGRHTLLNLRWQVAWVLSLVMGYFVGGLSGSAISALWGVAVANVAAYSLYWLLGWRAAVRERGA